jgi:ferredoxin
VNDKDLTFHYVCTREEARNLVERHKRFWVSNCGCREKRGHCDRSRLDVCLMFKGDIAGSGGSGKKEVSLTDVKQILQEAEEKHLVSRPFRNEDDMTLTDGICFCCDDCCEYFNNPSEIRSDKGAFIEETDGEKCTNCGLCVDVCYFGARKMDGEELVIDRNNCYGCGLCVEVCLEDCLQMVSRS